MDAGFGFSLLSSCVQYKTDADTDLVKFAFKYLMFNKRIEIDSEEFDDISSAYNSDVDCYIVNEKDLAEVDYPDAYVFVLYDDLYNWDAAGKPLRPAYFGDLITHINCVHPDIDLIKYMCSTMLSLASQHEYASASAILALLEWLKQLRAQGRINPKANIEKLELYVNCCN